MWRYINNNSNDEKGKRKRNNKSIKCISTKDDVSLEDINAITDTESC